MKTFLNNVKVVVETPLKIYYYINSILTFSLEDGDDMSGSVFEHCTITFEQPS